MFGESRFPPLDEREFEKMDANELARLAFLLASFLGEPKLPPDHYQAMKVDELRRLVRVFYSLLEPKTPTYQHPSHCCSCSRPQPHPKPNKDIRPRRIIG